MALAANVPVSALAPYAPFAPLPLEGAGASAVPSLPSTRDLDLIEQFPTPPSYSAIDFDYDFNKLDNENLENILSSATPSPAPRLSAPRPRTRRRRDRSNSTNSSSMPRAASTPARIYRRAPPPPQDRLYHRDFPPASSADDTHLTLESADGVSFCIPTYLVRRSSFFADLYSLPGAKDVVCLDGISGVVLAFELACAGDSRRTRRHSAPPIQMQRLRSSRPPAGASDSGNQGVQGMHGAHGGMRGSGLAFGFASTSHPPLVPPSAWSWHCLDQVLTLAFAYDLPHALERLAADSGEFYDPVLGYTLWSLVAAAKGEHTTSARPGATTQGAPVAFPPASSPTHTTLLEWAHALLRYDGAIPAWCEHALDTHLPEALDALEDLLASKREIAAELAASDKRIAAGATARQKEASWEEGISSKRHSFDIFVRRQSVATFFLKVVDTNATNAAPAVTVANINTNTTAVQPEKSSVKRSLSRGRSLRGKSKSKTQPPKCSPTCRPALKRKLTAAVGLVTRQSITEKFGTVEYFVEYTYEGITCPACREKAKEALVWVWCMKGPWHGGMGL